jgi:hypothetical protein
MRLKTEWTTLRRRVEAALHQAQRQAQRHDAEDLAAYGQDDREWVVIYRTAAGFCCMYKGLPVDFEDMLDVKTWAEEMDVRPWFIGL